MNEKKSEIAENLRRRAEALLSESPGSSQSGELKSVKELMHELAVHQAELELQNETLQETQLALQAAKDRFAELFEHAPVGYVVLDSSGIIRQTNATWQAMLNQSEHDFRGTPFADTLVAEDAPLFLARFRAFFRNPAKKQIVVRMKRTGSDPFYARIESKPRTRQATDEEQANPIRNELMVVVSDVSDLQAVQQQVEDQNRELQRANERIVHLNAVLGAIRNVNQLITMEDDREQLIQSTCDTLTENLSYYHAWIALLDEAGNVDTAIADHELSDRFDPLRGQLMRGEFPNCVRRAFAGEALVTVFDPLEECPECPFIDNYDGRAVLVSRLGFGEDVFGVLAVSVPASFATDKQEQRLFEEVAGDLAFALHKIEMTTHLDESRRRYREIFEASRDGFVMVDMQGRFVDANRAYCNLLGYSLDELRKMKNFYQITPKTWHDWEKSEIWEKRLLSKGYSGLYEKEYICKDGTVLPVELQSYAIRGKDGEIDYLWGIVRDISERKQTEAALREREEMFRLLAENSVDVIWKLDTRLRFTYTSPSIYPMTGYTPEEWIGSRLSDHATFKEFMQMARKAVIAMRTYKTFKSIIFEAVMLKKDGTPFPVEISSKLLLNEKGFPIGLQGTTRDITQRKQAEEEIRKYREHLEELVEERTRELQEAQEKLVRQERLAVLGQLAGSVGHELRNPLGVISNSVYLLRLIQPDADPKVQESLMMIESETENANRIITDLLDYARLKPAVRESLSVTTVVEEVLKTYPPPDDVKVSLRVRDDLPPVYVDQGHMEQVLENLLTNAYQAMPEGGALTVSADRRGDEIAVAVRDTGVGIPPENLEKIFEPLFTTKVNGIGLGLALCKQLMERNDGRIEVQSEVGEGSTFTLYIPSGGE